MIPQGFEADLTRKFEALERRMAHLETQMAVNGVHHETVETGLSEIRETMRWIVRLIIGSVIVAALAFAVKGGFNLL